MTVFVGRAAELRALIEAVQAPPCLTYVEGVAGAGKTRLIQEMAPRAAAGGAGV